MKEKRVGEPKAKELKRLEVSVRTVRNGYLLDIGDEAYMYFNPQSLIEGFFVRVGMERVGYLTTDEIRALTEAVTDGSLVKQLQQELNELRATIKEQEKEIRKIKKNK